MSDRANRGGGAYSNPPLRPIVESAGTDTVDTTKAKLKTPPKRSVKKDEVAELRARARAAATESKSFMAINIRVPVSTYRALVELSEEYHQPVTVVTRQCIDDGIRKYKDFSTPGISPFGRPAIARAAGAVQSNRSILQRLATAQAVHDEEESETDVLAATVERLASDFPLGALFPSTPANSVRLPPEPEPPGIYAADPDGDAH